MSSDPRERIGRSFARSFKTYDRAASEQAWIADRLVRALREANAPQRFRAALELGCGTGHLTRRIREAFGVDTLYVNDLAAEAKATAETFGARFLEGDAAHMAWPAPFDLIASASMIQWLCDPAAFLQRAARSLAPGGWLAVSSYGPRQFEELAAIGSAAGAPGLRTPGDLCRAIETELTVKTTGEAVRTMRFASPAAVLAHLRSTGVNGRAERPWTRARLEAFKADYARLFADESGTLRLTYHPVWLIAQKPA